MNDDIQNQSFLQAEATWKTMESVLDNIPCYVYIMNPATGEIAYANRAFSIDFPGTINGGIYGSILHEKILDICKNCPNYIEDVYFGKPNYFELELVDQRQWLAVQCSPILWVDGSHARLFSCQDITEKKQHESYIKNVGMQDQLTGLPNRRQCEQDLQMSLISAEADGSSGLVLYLDLDDFKIVNEGYGHEYGDQLLGVFSRCLKGIFTQSDVYRFNGDEFVVHTKSSIEELTPLLDRLLRRTKKQWRVLDKSFYCTISMGIVQYSGGGSTKVLLKNAEIAMMGAKKLGKNNYLIYSEEMEDIVARRAYIEMMLRNAINSKFSGFTVYYQPLIRTQTTQVFGAEALVRWFTSDNETIMPDEFIPLSEYLGLIVPLGEFVLRMAATDLKHINDTIDKNFAISVNFSIRQLQQPDILRRVEMILEETGVNPKNMVFEITEGMASSEFARLHMICEEFRKKGIRIAIDDFGTGYSSLGNLRSLPIDVIKIDQCFIQDMSDDSYSNFFIKLITNLGHSMGKQICIEGVETKEQKEYCLEAKADSIQGYYFYRPLPKEELLKILLEIKK